MLNTILIDQLTAKILSDNPSWNPDSAKKLANDYVESWDERLEPLLQNYLSSGTESDYQHGEFSIFLIRALRHNCSYLYAMSLMDAYIKDPINGKALILQR